MRKARFAKTTGSKPEVDEARIETVRQLARLKGYVTNIPIEQLPGPQVIGSYQDLWQAEGLVPDDQA